jgi:fructose-bisphosphate aldolase class II
MDAMASICRARFEAFGTAGNAGKIKVIPIAGMALRYASGSLDPQTRIAHAAE